MTLPSFLSSLQSLDSPVSTAPAPAEGKWWSRSSEIHRAVECPASTVLPRVIDVAGSSAEWGREVHAWKETGKATPRVEKWLAEITADPEALRQEWWPGPWHEVPIRLDRNGEWAFLEPPVKPETIERFFEDILVRGLIDYVGSSIVPHIVDLKTGRMPPDLPPARIPQLQTYALAWLKTHPDEPGVYVSIDHWPRYPKGAPPTRIGPDYISREDAQAWFIRINNAHEASRSRNADETARPGPHCQYCRSAFYCPAQE